jgi:uncharacterized protein YbjT (DUF2867 family)
MSATPSNVLVVGASGGIGRRVVAAAQRHERSVTALVRDLGRGERVLPGVELFQGDLEQSEGLHAAVQGVDAIVFTHGGPGSPDTARRIDYGGVANVLRALGTLPCADTGPSCSGRRGAGCSHRTPLRAALRDLLRRP